MVELWAYLCQGWKRLTAFVGLLSHLRQGKLLWIEYLTTSFKANVLTFELETLWSFF